MSAFLYLPPSADSDLTNALLTELRSDADVRAAFGTPARLFDDETVRAIFPYACLERHETEDASFVGVQARVHRLTLTTASRHGGREEASNLVGCLAAACERAELVLDHQNVVSNQVVYSDVVRPPEREHYRGLLRLKLLTRASPATSGEPS